MRHAWFGYRRSDASLHDGANRMIAACLVQAPKEVGSAEVGRAERFLAARFGQEVSRTLEGFAFRRAG